MSDLEPKLIVSKEWSITRLLIMMILFFGIGAGVLATLTFEGIRGRAASSQPSPTPFLSNPSPVPSPLATLEAPYIRLVSYKNSYAYRTNVPVEVYLHTANIPTAELYVVISYDPNVLEITQADIDFEPLYKSVDLNVNEEGRILASLFVNPELSHQPVTADTEIKIASLRFTAKSLSAEQSDISIEYVADRTTQTSLYRFSQDRDEATDNLLESVEGVVVSVTP